jgi:hypothetical protein
MKSRIKELSGEPYPDRGSWADAAPPPDDPIPAQMVSPEQAILPGRRLSSGGQGETDAERRALQVLMLARRTADEYVALANRYADATRADARTAAEQTVREAQDAAEQVRRDADRVLSEARTHAAELQREADEQFAAVIGRMVDERTALQQQIDALHEFDREVRNRLRVFLHGQLRALDETDTTSPEDPNADDTAILANALPAGRAEQP